MFTSHGGMVWKELRKLIKAHGNHEALLVANDIKKILQERGVLDEDGHSTNKEYTTEWLHDTSWKIYEVVRLNYK